MKSAANRNGSSATAGEGSSVLTRNDEGSAHASGEHPRVAASERDTVRPPSSPDLNAAAPKIPSRAPSSPDLNTALRKAPSRAPSSPDLRLSRELRLEQKLLEAEALLGRADPRRRLLQAAAMRSDEGLVDAVLSTLRDVEKED